MSEGVTLIENRPFDRPAFRADVPASQCILSIVVPTYNRFHHLQRCIEQTRRNVHWSGETVVVDGGSTDGTREWLASQRDLHVILEDHREGAVRAFNKGFRAARGEYVMWLNDDAHPLPGAVDAAIELIKRPDMSDVGMVAFYHNWHSERNVLDRVWHRGKSYELCHVRGYPYANFGLLRRSLLEQVGFADERFCFCGFDPDLSLTLQLKLNLKVVGCRRALIRHDEHDDARRGEDVGIGKQDNERLFAKWNLPAPGGYSDPVPAYQEMITARGLR